MKKKHKIEATIRDTWIEQFDTFASGKGLSVQQAATACGVSMATYYRIRNGGRTPSGSTIAALVAKTGGQFIVSGS